MPKRHIGFGKKKADKDLKKVSHVPGIVNPSDNSELTMEDLLKLQLSMMEEQNQILRQQNRDLSKSLRELNQKYDIMGRKFDDFIRISSSNTEILKRLLRTAED